MAEAVFRHKVRQAGLADRIQADSAGTGSWHVGERPHSGTRRLLAAKAIDYDHAARVIEPSDLSRFDYILTMDSDNLETVRAIAKRAGSASRAKVAPFLDFAANSRLSDVPDPYYTGNFEEVYSLVDAAADGLLSAIRQAENLPFTNP
jgi:protein-tyrosine phosphatase